MCFIGCSIVIVPDVVFPVLSFARNGWVDPFLAFSRAVVSDSMSGAFPVCCVIVTAVFAISSSSTYGVRL